MIQQQTENINETKINKRSKLMIVFAVVMVVILLVLASLIALLVRNMYWQKGQNLQAQMQQKLSTSSTISTSSELKQFIDDTKGIKFSYPATLSVKVANSEPQQTNTNEELISGTTTEQYGTVNFSDQAGRLLFEIGYYYPNSNKPITESSYSEDNLNVYGKCDLRYLDQAPKDIRIEKIGDNEVLTVAGSGQENYGCYYIAGDPFLVVFSTEKFSNLTDYRMADTYIRGLLASAWIVAKSPTKIKNADGTVTYADKWSGISLVLPNTDLGSMDGLPMFYGSEYSGKVEFSSLTEGKTESITLHVNEKPDAGYQQLFEITNNSAGGIKAVPGINKYTEDKYGLVSAVTNGVKIGANEIYFEYRGTKKDMDDFVSIIQSYKEILHYPIDYCMRPGVDTAIGGVWYPSKPEYRLGYLGQLLSTEDCSVERFNQVAKSIPGLRIIARTMPSASLQKLLLELHFVPLDPSLKQWQTGNLNGVDMQEFLKIRPFLNELSGSDCVNCG